LFTGKHVGQDRTITRAHETVGYIVIEAGHSTSGDIEIEAARGPDLPAGYVQGNFLYTFVAPFSTTPAVAVLSQVAMDGSDGSWAVLAEISSTTSMKVAIDEDQILDTERSHTPEELDYVVFSAAGSVQLIPTTLVI
jgi:thiamine monophosphate kinase